MSLSRRQRGAPNVECSGADATQQQRDRGRMEYPGGGEYGGGPDGLGHGGGEFGGDEYGVDEYGGGGAPSPPSEPPLHLHPSELDRLAIGDDYGGGDQLNGDDYYGGAAPPPAPPPAYSGDEYGNGAGVVDYGAAAPLPPPPDARDEYTEPPSPMDPHCASMGGQVRGGSSPQPQP